MSVEAIPACEVGLRVVQGLQEGGVFRSREQALAGFVSSFDGQSTLPGLNSRLNSRT